MRILALALLYAGLLLHTVAAEAATFNVTTTAELRTALTLAAANNQDDTINVAAGFYPVATTLTYWPTTENRALTIQGPPGAGAILDGGGAVQIMSVTSAGVANDTNASLRVIDLTFQNGNATGALDDGGGLYLYSARGFVRVQGCRFIDNAADGDGGGLYQVLGVISAGPVSLVNSYLEGNVARGLTGNGDGGGAFLATSNFEGIVAYNNSFIGNQAKRHGAGLEVDGIDIGGPNELVAGVDIQNSLFDGNTVTGPAGNGGGAALSTDAATLRTNQFLDNSAANGGAVYVRPGHVSVTSMNGVFMNNHAIETVPGTGGHGGAFAIEDGNDSWVWFVFNTFAGNDATIRGGGGTMRVGGSAARIEFYNNVIWGNTAAQAGDFWVDDNPLNTVSALVDVYGNLFMDFVVRCEVDVTCVPNVNSGDNDSADPMLADIAGNDPHLLQGSPAIDNGSLLAPHGSTHDYEGDTRSHDGDGDGLAIFDIGADEYTGPPADSDGDGIPDGADNCIDVANPAQVDTDFDSIGNRCDADIGPQPNDCVVNVIDLGVLKAAFFAVPGNPNWNADADFNVDDVVNAIDLGVMKTQFFGAPGPSGWGCN